MNLKKYNYFKLSQQQTILKQTILIFALVSIVLIYSCKNSSSSLIPEGFQETKTPKNSKWIQLMKAVINPPKLDSETSIFLDNFEKSLSNFELGDLHSILQYSDEDGWRRMGVMGYLKGDTYRFEKKFRCVPESFGECYIEGGVQPVPSQDKLYNFYLQGELHVGDFNWDSFVNVIHDILIEAENDNAFLPDIEVARKLFPKVHGEHSIRILARAEKNFPKTVFCLTRYFIIKDIASKSKDKTTISLDLRLNRENIANDYPALDTYLKHMEKRVRSAMEIMDASGASVAQIYFDTHDFRFYIRASSHNGRFIPTSDSALPHSPFYSIRWKVHFDFWGLLVDFPDIPVLISYSKREENVEARFSLSKIPEVKVTGGLFGVIPPWLIDIVIPSNLEEIAQTFFKTLAAGGRPLLWYQHYTLNRGGNAIRMIWNLEMPDNGLLTFAASLYEKRLSMKKKAELELAHLWVKVLEAVEDDLFLTR